MAVAVTCGSSGRVGESLDMLINDSLDLFRCDGYRAGRGAHESRGKRRTS